MLATVFNKELIIETWGETEEEALSYLKYNAPNVSITKVGEYSREGMAYYRFKVEGDRKSIKPLRTLDDVNMNV